MYNQILLSLNILVYGVAIYLIIWIMKYFSTIIWNILSSPVWQVLYLWKESRAGESQVFKKKQILNKILKSMLIFIKIKCKWSCAFPVNCVDVSRNM